MATISIPNPVPSAIQDAEKLRKAFQGWGTDEKAMIDVLAHRDAAQRKQIMIAYEEQYKENLVKRIESETSGHFERAVHRWIFDPVERQAIMANIAIKSNAIDFPVIIEIACVNSSTELLVVKQVYQSLFKCSLEEDIASHTAGDFRKFLVALVGTYRYDGEEINTELAQIEAKILNDAIVKGQLNDDEIIRILSTRSKVQLRTTLNCYKDAHCGSISKALSTETPNEFAIALRVAIRCMTSPKKYFEKVLRRTLQKSITDEDTLTRVIVMHAEKDLKEIKEGFQARTNMTLEQAVASKTSGDYKTFLLALIGDLII